MMNVEKEAHTQGFKYASKIWIDVIGVTYWQHLYICAIDNPRKKEDTVISERGYFLSQMHIHITKLYLNFAKYIVFLLSARVCIASYLLLQLFLGDFTNYARWVIKVKRHYHKGITVSQYLLWQIASILPILPRKQVIIRTFSSLISNIKHAVDMQWTTEKCTYSQVILLRCWYM